MTLPSKIIRLASAGGAEVLTGTDRTVRFVLSDSSVARDNDTIATKGWNTSNYLRNPVVLFGHDSSNVDAVIGRMVAISVRGDQLVGDIEFMSGEINPVAETVYQMVRQGYLNAVSVGFIPTEGKPAKGRGAGAWDFTAADLLEVSVVPVPALPTALAEARAAGIDTAPVIAWARRIMETTKMKKRDLYDCGWLAQLLQSLACLEAGAEYESEMEGDNSPVPQMLADAIKTLGGILVAMTAEEVAELIGEEVGEGGTAGQKAMRTIGMAFRTVPAVAEIVVPGIDFDAVVRAALDKHLPQVIARAGKTVSAATERCIRDAHGKIAEGADALLELVAPDDTVDTTTERCIRDARALRARKARAAMATATL